MTPVLVEVLNAIYAAAIPAADRRRLSSQAVGHAMRAEACPSASPCSSPTELLEEALHAVAKVGNMPHKPTITAAKTWLRSVNGGTPVASRIGRLSKGRNVQAHPDITIIRDIESLAADSTTEGDSSDTLSDTRDGPDSDADNLPSSKAYTTQSSPVEATRPKPAMRAVDPVTDYASKCLILEAAGGDGDGDRTDKLGTRVYDIADMRSDYKPYKMI